jgi:hypothetical protein
MAILGSKLARPLDFIRRQEDIFKKSLYNNEKHGKD